MKHIPFNIDSVMLAISLVASIVCAAFGDWYLCSVAVATALVNAAFVADDIREAKRFESIYGDKEQSNDLD
jgi:hypothetical protein